MTIIVRYPPKKEKKKIENDFAINQNEIVINLLKIVFSNCNELAK
jgi:hypothetical protein